MLINDQFKKIPFLGSFPLRVAAPFTKNPITRTKILLSLNRDQKARAISEGLLKENPTDQSTLLLAGAVGKKTRDSYLWFRAYEGAISQHNENLLHNIFNDPDSVFHPYGQQRFRSEEILRYNNVIELISNRNYSSALTQLESLSALSKAQWQVIGAKAQCYYELRDARFKDALISLGAANFHAPELIKLLHRASDDGETFCAILSTEKTGNHSVGFSLRGSDHFIILIGLSHTINDNFQKAQDHAINRHAWGAVFNNIRNEVIYKDFLFNYHLKKNRPLHIISMVREPISLELSRYFFLKEYIYRENANATRESFLDFMRDEFNSEESPLSWFDREVKANFGFDVYSTPFDKKKGYTIYQHNNIKFLVMTLENLSNTFELGVSNLLNIKGVKLKKFNSGTNHAYAAKYKELKNRLKLTENELINIYKKARLDHFYTEDDLEVFRATWVN